MENLSLATEELIQVRDKMAELLEKDHNYLFIGINAKLLLMINQLSTISSGKTFSPVAGSVTSVHIPQPVTSFFGEKMSTPQKVTTEDLTPKELEKKIFLEKADRLIKSFPELSNEQIIEAYKVDPKVVRYVGKLAGLEDFKKAEINNQFLDDIRLGLQAQEDMKNIENQTEEEINAANAK